jgi:hypothetical protein
MVALVEEFDIARCYGVGSEKREALFLARLAVQEKIVPVKATGTGQIGSRVYDYADLSDIQLMLVPLLTANKLLLEFDPVTTTPGMIGCITRVVHVSGEWQSVVVTVKADGVGAQDAGKAITYCKRYGLSSLFAIYMSGDEDDGASAQAASRRAPVPQRQPPQQQVDRVKQFTQPAPQPTEPSPIVQPATAPDEASEKRRLLAHFEKELAAGHLDAKDDLGIAWRATNGNVAQCIKILEGTVASREQTIREMFEIGLEKGLLNLGDEKRLLEMGHIKASIWLAELEHNAASKELP